MQKIVRKNLPFHCQHLNLHAILKKKILKAKKKNGGFTMLVQFSLTNYKNFKETQALDLTEGKISEHARHLLKSPIDRLGILPAAVIY